MKIYLGCITRNNDTIVCVGTYATEAAAADSVREHYLPGLDKSAWVQEYTLNDGRANADSTTLVQYFYKKVL
jgi:hypothetical protein